MTLAISLLHEDRIELLSDGAIYEPDGTITEIREKVKVSNRIPMAIQAVGHAPAGDILGTFFIGLTDHYSFDETINLIATMLEKQKGREIPEGKNFGFFISGISESLGPCHYFTWSLPVESYEQFDLIRWSGRELGNSSGITEEEIAAIGITEEVYESGAFDFRTYGLPIAEAMRRTKATNFMEPDKPARYIVGGFLQLTTITASGTFTELLQIWPDDEVGKPIDPFATERLAA